MFRSRPEPAQTQTPGPRGHNAVYRIATYYLLGYIVRYVYRYVKKISVPQPTIGFVGRIRILSDNVANKIAAGEVVERPASVVKELLENSLDAGATEFRIDIEGGGRRLIRMIDNGSGMLRDDALLAFERHATSKLADVKDLLSIATLGFRGEALPSIASVARLILETRSADEQSGARVEIAGGKILRCDEAALAPGTSIGVSDLFFNVPARKNSCGRSPPRWRTSRRL